MQADSLTAELPGRSEDFSGHRQIIKSPQSLWAPESLTLVLITTMFRLPCNVGDLGREDPLEEGMAIHSSILVWRIPWTEELGGLQSVG